MFISSVVACEDGAGGTGVGFGGVGGGITDPET